MITELFLHLEQETLANKDKTSHIERLALKKPTNNNHKAVLEERVKKNQTLSINSCPLTQ